MNTETNYFTDEELNLFYEATYSPHMSLFAVDNNGQEASQSENDDHRKLNGKYHLIDIIRVYYEFGPMLCGLVNVIDFVPKFYSSPIVDCGGDQTAGFCASSDAGAGAGSEDSQQDNNEQSLLIWFMNQTKIPNSESLTRLIRRSMGWFDQERKRILNETSSRNKDENDDGTAHSDAVNLKVCNLQVHHKILPKSQLIQLNVNNVFELINTRAMAHERVETALDCSFCQRTFERPNMESAKLWCPHLIDLNQVYRVKFVRLAYIVPVYNKYAIKSLWPAPASRMPSNKDQAVAENQGDTAKDPDYATSTSPSQTSEDEGSPSSSSTSSSSSSDQQEGSDEEGEEEEEAEGWAKRDALLIVSETNKRHSEDESAHQLSEPTASADQPIVNPLIGQLTYRLFAPCQLVNSSSCFAINPVNSSSPLARRGSVDLNSSGNSNVVAAETLDTMMASQSSLSTLTTSGKLSNHQHHHDPSSASHVLDTTQQMVSSFGAFFPALSHDLMRSSPGPSNLDSNIVMGASGSLMKSEQQTPSKSGGLKISNQFESIETIKRRMEIYVTTNSMKVLAGETIFINLSDDLSCLSTAIEQSIVRAQTSATWVAVFVLYAAVDEPHLPGQLLAQQKMRELTLINEESEDCPASDDATTTQDINQLFDNDFKGNLKLTEEASQSVSKQQEQQQAAEQDMNEIGGVSSADITVYNSAYDRTVALPTEPENTESNRNLNDFPLNFLVRDQKLTNGAIKFDENDLNDAFKFEKKFLRRKRESSRRLKRRESRHRDSQCSII